MYGKLKKNRNTQLQSRKRLVAKSSGKLDLDSRLRGNDLFFNAVSGSVITSEGDIQIAYIR